MPFALVRMVSDFPLTVAVAVFITAELVVEVGGVAACVDAVGVLCVPVVDVELLPVVVELPQALTSSITRIAASGMSRRD